MKELFEVLNRGVSISIQDMGREKYRHLGIPVSGAMDQLAFQIGNLLLGNKFNAASIEIAFGGIVLKALNQISIVITGGNLKPSLNGKAAEMYKVIDLEKDDILDFNGAVNGVYSYISVPGGIKSEFHFESQSTYTPASLGLVITKGTLIYGSSTTFKLMKRGLQHEFIPKYPKHNSIKFIRSSHFDKIPYHIKFQILSKPLTIGTFNKMGMYLSTIKTNVEPFNSNILSEGTTFGTIQVLPTGQPIILLADSQTTGGYATLGTVIVSDLWKLVQMQKGNTIQLLPIKLDEAKILNKKHHLFLKCLQIECRNKEV
ncbi:biotin-dependent carboxyltransferase family protein [Gottfriedia sp. NPDC056225]|uniref:5-oxoprolinase subunit C family protein n=1 Tax=Gottfriedia sp. NPDC056225 TaxID=3345751 RepID=UPI001558D565|nr:biotin-dependent carboxyltransferase family protein [Arthrobacter citreus]